jgi:general secretion pathway protein G
MKRVSLQAGFTLIEIMVVVFILGLLVTLVAPKIIGRTDQARQTKARADVKAIEEALKLYKLDNGFYPSTGEGLEALMSPSSRARNFNPDGYLEKMPEDPWGTPYQYLNDGRNFIVLSLGADGIEGGDGYDADIDQHGIR